MSPWWSLLGLLSWCPTYKSSHHSSFGYRAPVDGFYEYPIFKSVSWTWLWWWRHQMETISALLALCVENSPGTGESPSQRPVTRSFGVFFDLRIDKRLSKQPWGFGTPSSSLWRHCHVFMLQCTGILAPAKTAEPHAALRKVTGYENTIQMIETEKIYLNTLT